MRTMSQLQIGARDSGRVAGRTFPFSQTSVNVLLEQRQVDRNGLVMSHADDCHIMNSGTVE